MNEAAGANGAHRGRKRRADHERNRARILHAAEEVFTAGGPSASTEDVAHRAGVAIGTVFRHFPTKAALLEALFIDRLTTLTESARQLAQADDAGPAFFEFVERWVELSANKLTFVDALTADGVDVAATVDAGSYRTVRAALIDAVDVLLRRAQRSGSVRADVGVAEVEALLYGAARAIEATTSPTSRQVTITVITDGLRPHGYRS